MPELPEVETVRKKITKALKGETISEVVVDEQDKYLFAFAKQKDVKKALLGAKVMGSGRKGKYFWLELNRKPWPIFHLGMSGNISLLKKTAGGHHKKIWGGNELQSEGEDRDRLLWFSRLLLVTKSGLEMALLDPRRFGRMWLTDDPWESARIKKLGWDPLLDFPDAKTLGAKLRKRKAPIKSILLDQKVFAGIGNYLADEILYQAKISPHRLGNQLSDRDVARIRKQTIGICETAVKAEANYEKFPKNWLFHTRWGKKKNAVTGRKQKIQHDDIGGRTTAWVPSIQK